MESRWTDSWAWVIATGVGCTFLGRRIPATTSREVGLSWYFAKTLWVIELEGVACAIDSSGG